MANEHPCAEAPLANAGSSAGEIDRLPQSAASDPRASLELACIEKLLSADWRIRRGQPLTAEEILMIGAQALEPLFQEPAMAPVPEHLLVHWSVHGCVAEYEDQIEELDRWKALQLSRWLEQRVGGSWLITGRHYRLEAERGEGDVPDKFWLAWIEAPIKCAKLSGGDSERD